MKKEFDEKLVKDFPLLYADRYESIRNTCMGWGFDVRDGWYQIIYNLSSKLEPLIQKYINDNPDLDREEYPRASQVKEKFGTLRFYMAFETDEMFDIINEAESESAQTCEVCAAAGTIRKGGWIVTRCDNCYNKNRET